MAGGWTMIGRVIVGQVTGLALLIAAPAHALGPVDGRLMLDLGFGDYESSGAVSDFERSVDADSFILSGETWLGDNWGLRGEFFNTSLDSSALEDPSRLNVDVTRRLFSLTDNTFVSAGVGWERMQLDTGGNTDGVRLSLEGRVGLLGIVSLYGQSVWMPSLSSVDGYSDISGHELQTGILFEPLPFLTLRAGFRQLDVDYESNGTSGLTKSNGIILGTGIHW